MKKQTHISNPDLEVIARVLKALAHPIRLSIAIALLEKELTVFEISHLLQRQQSTISQHFLILFNAHILAKKKIGANKQYRLRNQEVHKILYWIRLNCIPPTHNPKSMYSQKVYISCRNNSWQNSDHLS